MNISAFLNFTLLFAYDKNNTDFVSGLINYCFEHDETLNYITDNADAESYIEKGLSDKMVYLYSYLYFAEQSPTKKVLGNVVVVSDLERLKMLFIQKSFRAHSTILVFYDKNRATFYDEPFKTATNTDGVRLLVCRRGFNQSFSVQYINEDKTVAIYNASTTLFLTGKRLQFKWFPKFENGKHFTTSCFNCPPYIYVNENGSAYDGTEYHIIKTIAAKSNWPLKFHSDVKENESEYEHVKNSVLFHANDVGACSPWLVSFANSSDFEFTKPYTEACVTFLVPKPHHMPFVTYVYQPLSNGLWVLLFVAVLLLATALWFVAVFYRRLLAYDIMYVNYYASIVYSIRVITLGGLKDIPRLKGFRMVLITSTVFALLFSTAYSAGFSTILTTIRLSKPINTLQDMFEQKLNWGSVFAQNKYLFPADTYVERKITESFVLETSFEYRDKMIRRNKYAVFVKRLSKYYLTDSEDLDDYGRNNLKVLSDCADIYAIVLIFKKNSPFTEIFNVWLQRFLEYGLLQHWYKIMVMKHDVQYMNNFFHPRYEDIRNKPLNYARLEGAFLLLFAGLSIATILFVAEYFRHNF